MTVRNSFVDHFGEEQASKVEESALMHLSHVSEGHKHDKWGDDPFQYHLLTCIAFDCFTRDKNRKYHGITVPLEELKAWALEYGDLYLYRGDIPDYLALMVGAYHPWINWKKAGEEPPANMEENESELNRWREMSFPESINEMHRLAQEILGNHGDFTPEDK